MIINRYILGYLLKTFVGASLVLYGVMIIVQWIRIGQLITMRDLDVCSWPWFPWRCSSCPWRSSSAS